MFQLERQVVEKKTGELTTQTVYGIASLSEKEADAERLLSLARQHWNIENKSHWVRDVIFDEDRSQERRGRLPQVMATVRTSSTCCVLTVSTVLPRRDGASPHALMNPSPLLAFQLENDKALAQHLDDLTRMPSYPTFVFAADDWLASPRTLTQRRSGSE